MRARHVVGIAAAPTQYGESTIEIGVGRFTVSWRPALGSHGFAGRGARRLAVTPRLQLDDYDAIVDALCRAWNALTPERIRSLTRYPYLEQVKV
jgi:hypothetical protein